MVGWILFTCVTAVFFLVDLITHRKPAQIRVKEALLWSGVWIALALLFNAYLYVTEGGETALAFFTGYLVEQSLSVDNLFVFLSIFAFFKTPGILLHRILFLGVLSAVILRGIFIFLGIAIIQWFSWVYPLLGLLLIVLSIQFFKSKKESFFSKNNLFLRLCRRFFRMTEEYQGDKFFVRMDRKLYVTPLFIVLIIIELTDVVFAVDSIPAILGITRDPLVVYSSNIFAVLSLRSLFFVLAHSLEAFRYLHYALALILCFIGLKMVFSPLIDLPLLLVCGIVIVILLGSIFFSLLKRRVR